MSAFAPKKGGAGLSLPSSSSADAQRAVNKAIEDLAEKYGVDLPAGDAGAGAGAGAGPGVEERYDAATEAFFAAENDAAAANKKRIVSQAAFDEVVNENIEDFEMEPEEALADAIEQFEKQGVDLSAVVRKVGGASSAPVASSLEKLKGDMPQDELLSLLAEISSHLSQDVENRIAFYASSGEVYLLNAIGKIKDEASDELHAAVLEVYSKSFWRGRPLSDRPYFDSECTSQEWLHLRAPSCGFRPSEHRGRTWCATRRARSLP